MYVLRVWIKTYRVDSGSPLGDRIPVGGVGVNSALEALERDGAGVKGRGQLLEERSQVGLGRCVGIDEVVY
jgi:hypothetical protein